MRVLVVCMILISMSCGIVQAAGMNLALTVPMVTRHFPESSPDLNENNHGLGLEYTIHKDVALTAGKFTNSLSKDTYYVGVVYTPLRFLGLHTGVVLGLDVSGSYNEINPLRPLIGSLRLATGPESALGFNIDVLSGVNRGKDVKAYGAVAVSMKYSF